MKALFFIPAFGLLLSCRMSKESIKEQPVIEEVVAEEELPIDTNYRVVGTVHASGACFYIETITATNEMKKLYAVNLEEIYKVEGARIKFKYILSRAPLPQDCAAEIVVVVSDVTRMR